MPRKKEEPSLAELSGLFKEGLSKAITRPSIFGYVPHEKQIRFHSSTKKGRLYIGGNRSGKTVGGVAEDVYRLKGQHPYLEVPPAPVRGRIVATSYNEGIKQIIIPELAKWLPPSDLINGSWEDSYSKQEKQLTLTNGSTCDLMSYEQDVQKFAGTSRHFIHFDEEPPKAIFDECKMRLLDTGGSWWMTMTPVEGMTWVYDELYIPGLTPGNSVAVIAIDTSENPYLSEAEIEHTFAGFNDPDDIKARKEGKFVMIGGLVYKEFKSHHVIPPLNEENLARIKSWTHYASMDHGFNNPTAWLWHAVSPDGLVITYDELYDREKVVSYYAREIHKRNVQAGRRAPEIYVGDPAITQRQGVTGDSVHTTYVREGIPIALGNNDVSIGVNKVNNYLAMNKWAITENCHNLIRELQRVRWKVFESAKKRHENNVREEIHKKDDHAPDSARYFFSMMPDLYIPPVGRPKGKLSINDIVGKSIGAVPTPVGPSYTDPNLGKSKTQWVVDDVLGGEW